MSRTQTEDIIHLLQPAQHQFVRSCADAVGAWLEEKGLLPKDGEPKKPRTVQRFYLLEYPRTKIDDNGFLELSDFARFEMECWYGLRDGEGNPFHDGSAIVTAVSLFTSDEGFDAPSYSEAGRIDCGAGFKFRGLFDEARAAFDRWLDDALDPVAAREVRVAVEAKDIPAPFLRARLERALAGSVARLMGEHRTDEQVRSAARLVQACVAVRGTPDNIPWPFLASNAADIQDLPCASLECSLDAVLPLLVEVEWREGSPHGVE